MNTSTRKQRELAQREQLIKDVARHELIKVGYLGLNMDRIAEATEYSKGTIYQHFSSKEDLLGALAIDSHTQRIELFERAAGFEGRPRERMTAIGVADELFVSFYSDHFQLEQILSVNSIVDKLSEERAAGFAAQQYRALDMIRGVIEDGITAGDLALAEGLDPLWVLYGLWSMAVGGHHIECNPQACAKLAGVDMNAALWKNYQVLLDGYGWQPLSTEWDYPATVERIKTEVFADEYRELAERAA
jgi:AcrR family transcriptional regulator